MLREQRYYIAVTNENAFPVDVELDGISVHSLVTTDICSFASMEPGETRVEEFTALNRVIWKSGCWDRIRLKATAKNDLTDGTLFRDMHIGLEDFDASVLPAYTEPILGASAKEQVLGSENGIEVSLVGLGFYPERFHTDPEGDDAELKAYFRIDNTTDELHAVAIPAFGINGVNVANAHAAVLDTVELQPHRSCYLCKTVMRAEVRRLTLRRSFYDKQLNSIGFAENFSPLIDGICSLTALTVIDGKGVWMQIALDRPTEGSPFEPEGKLLYEDKYWSVLQEPPTEDMHPDVAALWLSNRTDDTVCYYIYCEKVSIAAGCIGPHTVQRVPIYITEGQRSTGLKIRRYLWTEEYNYIIKNQSQGRVPDVSGLFRMLTAEEAIEP